MSRDMQQDSNSNPLKVREATLCPFCSRELEIVPMVKIGGRVVVELRCAKHGSNLPAYKRAFVGERELPLFIDMGRKGSR